MPMPVEGEVLFGLFPVLLALRKGRRSFHRLYIRKGLLDSSRPLIQELRSLVADHGVEVVPSAGHLLDRLSQARPHQGVCLDVSRLTFNLLHPQPHETSCRPVTSEVPQIWVVLDSVQDPMNFGAVLRSCYFLGVDQVITVSSSSCPPSPVVSKASAGALEVMDVSMVEQLLPFLQEMKQQGWQVMGTVGMSQCDISRSQVTLLHQARLDSNTLLLLGNEGCGMSEEIKSLCDDLVAIAPGRPLAADLDSLNVSVATGIILYHLLSTRMGQSPQESGSSTS